MDLGQIPEIIQTYTFLLPITTETVVAKQK